MEMQNQTKAVGLKERYESTEFFIRLKKDSF